MIEFEVWIYRALIAGFFVVVFYLFKQWSTKIDRKFDQLIEAINNLRIDTARQNSEIFNVTKRIDSHDTRLGDHSKRIRTIENNQNKCENFKTHV